MDCPTITVHTRKCYKALIDSGAAKWLIRYPTYHLIDDSFKTPIQLTTSTLNTADGLPMTTLGMMELHLRIAEFKFTHNFIVCNRLPKYWNNVWHWYTKENSHCHMLGTKRRTAIFRRMAVFSHKTQNCEQKVTIGIVKSTLKIPSRHNSIIPIKIKGNSFARQTACFISDQELTKEKDPSINIVNRIHKIKGWWSVNILVSNYSNKHVMFNKGEYIGHLGNIDEEENSHPHENSGAYTTSSVTSKRMMPE